MNTEITAPSYNTYNGYTIQIWKSSPGPMGRYSARISRNGAATTLDRNSISEARKAAEWYVDHQLV